MEETLEQMDPIDSMSEYEFRDWVAAKIVQTPIVGRVIQCIDLNGEATEKDVGELLREFGSDSEALQPRDVLEALARWMSYFLPTHYETARDTIKLIRATNL